MKKLLAILFCGAFAASLLSSCCPKCPCETEETKDTTQAYVMTAEDSALWKQFMEIRTQHVPYTASIPMNDACKQIYDYNPDPKAITDDVVYLSNGDLLTLLANRHNLSSGWFIHRGKDAAGERWLVWADVPAGQGDNGQVYVLANKSCMCKPCCADPANQCK